MERFGSKSNPIFTFHHYNQNLDKSCLAKCIINDNEFNKDKILNESNIKEWMKNNLQRIDIILDKNLSVFTLNLFEASLRCKYKPRYEGYKSQRK